MVIENNLVYRDIYILKSKDGFIFYSPLRGKAFWANDDNSQKIYDLLVGGEDIDKKDVLFKYVDSLCGECKLPRERKVGKKDKIVIILSQKCNLNCSYCYAHEAHSDEELSQFKLELLIRDSLNDNPRCSFSFIGGGEPTFTWDLFCWAVEKIRSNSSIAHIGLTTNGTLLNEERCKWIKEKGVNISLSFDILPEIQNEQRPFIGGQNNSFAIVDKNLHLLIDLGIYPRIRATITESNLMKMEQMITFIADNYPEIKKVHFEHVTSADLTMDDYYTLFEHYFFKAKRVAESASIELRNSIASSIDTLRTRFCPAEICVTPNGDIVACHRVSSECDDNYSNFVYGKIDSNIVFFKHQATEVLDFYEYKQEKCETCFSRWHCAGACPQNRKLFSENQFNQYCEFTRNILQHELERRIGIDG